MPVGGQHMQDNIREVSGIFSRCLNVCRRRALLLTMAGLMLVLNASCSDSYTEAEIGVEEIVDEYIESRNSYARYRTHEEETAVWDLEYEWFQNEANEQERERFIFEELIRGRMIGARDSLPEELKPGGVLEAAYHDAAEECTALAGYEGLRIYNASKTYFETVSSEYELTVDDFVDLRHECAKYAIEYPTLSESERERLLDLQRDFYLDIVRTFVEENPDAVVPIQ